MPRNSSPPNAGARIPGNVGWSIGIGLGFGYRVHELTGQSLWPDEIYSLDVSRWSLSEVWTRLVHDHVPLYTIILGWWCQLAGTSEFSLRYFSVIMSTLSIALLVPLARRVLPRPATLAAIVLYVISPFQLYYAQEGVAYALLGALTLLSCNIFLRWLTEPPWRIIAAQGALYSALLYTHYAGLFLLITHVSVAVLGLTASEARRRSWCDVAGLPGRAPSVRWTAAWCAGIALFLPWVVTHLNWLGDNLAGGSHFPLTVLVGIALIDLSFGPILTAHLDAGTAVDRLVLRHLTMASLTLFLCMVLAVLPRRTGSRRLLHWSSLVAFLHAVVPYAIVFVMVLFSREFASRYGFPASPWMPVVAVSGLWTLRPIPRYAGVGLLTAFSLWGSLIYFEHPGFARLDFRSASNYIMSHHQPGDEVLVTAPYVASTFTYYAQLGGVQLPTTPLPDRIPMDEVQTQQSLAQITQRASRVWLLRWQDYYSDPRQVIPTWLDRHGVRLVHRHLPGGIMVDLWLRGAPIVHSVPATTSHFANSVGPVHLLGYEASREDPEHLQVTFYWQSDTLLGIDYTTFIHVVAADGHRISQADGRPYDGQYPTTLWPTGAIIEDRRVVPLDPCIHPGHYEIHVGFYDLRTMQRLGTPGYDTLRLPLEVKQASPAQKSASVLRLLPAAVRLEQHLPADHARPCQ